MDINYSPDQLEQIDHLKSYIEEYCDSNGIDASTYTKYLDSKTSLDPKILNDPVFQAYWQLSYLQLEEILTRPNGQAVFAEVELPEDGQAKPHLDQTIQQILSDNPALMAFAALRDGDEHTSAEVVMKLIEKYNVVPEANESQEGYVNTQARELGEELGKDMQLGGFWDQLITTEEGLRTTETFLLEGLAEMDQQLTTLKDALSSGEISAEEFSADVGSISAYRELYLGLIQNIENALNNTIEMFSNLLKKQEEIELSLARRFAVA